MKKVSKILTFIFIMSMFFSACQKEELTKTIEETSPPEVFYKSNRLAFNTVETYNNTIANLSEPGTIKNLEQTNESPLKTLKKSINQNEELYDDFLLSILNEDKIVQIGRWIIKVDMENELVSVISEENSKLYDDLVDNADNVNIYRFTTGDNVLDLLGDGSKGTVEAKQLKKSCDAAAAKNRWLTYSYIAAGTEIQVRYFKGGIYYTLISASQNLGGTLWQQAAYVSMKIEYSYKRCRKNSTGVKNATVSRRLITDKYRFYVYRGTRRLQDFDLKTDFTMDFYNRFGDFIITEYATLKIVG